MHIAALTGYDPPDESWIATSRNAFIGRRGKLIKGGIAMKKIVIRALAIILAGVLFLIYGECVRHNTIVSAELVEDNGAEYIISFDGESHIYER